MAKPRRASTYLSGVLAIDKPAGWTSHDVVARIRRLTGEGRVGHAGTLDPDATGLLLVLVGRAAKLSAALSADTKSYRATLAFGMQTNTDDAAGQCVAHSTPDARLFDDPDCAESILSTFRGELEQLPPAFAAIKQGGQVAYRAARAGNPLELKPRRIAVYQADVVERDGAAQTWTVDFTVSKGTYIRALARDIGLAAGTHAHLAALRRTQSGAISVDEAYTIKQIERVVSVDPSAIADCFLTRERLAAALDPLPVPDYVPGPRIGPSVVAMGAFDGVHRGHRDLLSHSVQLAHEQGYESVAVTFDPLPRCFFNPQSCPKPLVTLEEKLQLIQSCGVDNSIVIPFTHELARMSASDFLTRLLPTRVDVRVLVVGENFHLGAGGAVSAKQVRDVLPRETELSVVVRDLVKDETGQVISASRIRELRDAGQMDAANRLLK
ncbi:MAG: tRNA pseudouridine(55) synthase TruB [Actinomycetes bacterium]|jgi:tRNA pseudouridine55 synthase|nr:tRNA pseudouridine(55) synthase TruB [Actinomycetes bacterium]